MNLQRQHFVAALVWLGLMGLAYFYFESHSRPAASISANGELRIPRAPDGHYHVDGAINGYPVRFLIDTGASRVSMGRALAQRAGVQGGRPAEFSTAGGNVMGEIVTDIPVSASSFRVTGLSVAVMSDLGEEALLGQNFLRHFDVLIRDGEMLLRPQSASAQNP